MCLHADNCAGQNKNSTLLQFLMWRVLTGLHNTVNLHFMIPGHTKFPPDACFGLVKRKFRKTPVSSLEDLARVVDDSAACNVCQLVGAQDGCVLAPTRDWAGFLSSYFCHLDDIKKYHHFRFEGNHPGAVFLRKTAVAEEEKRKLLRVAWKPSVVDKAPYIILMGSHTNVRSTYIKKYGSTAEMTYGTSSVPILTVQSHQSFRRTPALLMNVKQKECACEELASLYIPCFNWLFSKPHSLFCFVCWSPHSSQI